MEPNRNSGFADARQLEDIKFMQWISDAAVKREEAIKASERALAARGLRQSGARFMAEVNIVFAAIEDIVEKAVAYRQELAAKVPALVEPSNLRPFKDKLDQYIDGGVNAFRQRSTLQPRGAAGPALMREAERRAYSAKARLNNRLAAMPLEARLGMHEMDEPRVTNLHISNSTIANLNLGNVIGDLNSSIEQLGTAGHNDLGEKFGKMTEAIAASADLDDSTRKEVLEHLAVVSTEAAKPVDKRRMGPLKTSLEAIKSGVAVGTQLLTLWQGVEHALKGAGII